MATSPAASSAVEMTVSSPAGKRTIDDKVVGMDQKRTKSDDREINVDPIHDTPFGLCLQARTFLIGPHAEPFVIHRDLLRQRCVQYWQFLQDAAKEDPSNVEHSSHQFPDEDPRTFAMFVAWLYTGEIPPSPDDELDWNIPRQPRLVPGREEEYERWYDEDLVDLWVFAATNRIYELSNASVSSLAMQNDKYNRTTTRPALARAFEYIGPEPGLQSYLIDEAVFWLGSSKVPKDISDYPVQYVSRILEKIVARQSKKQNARGGKIVHPRWRKNPCDYHTHPQCGEIVAAKRECRKYWVSSPAPRYHEEIYELLDETVILIVGTSKIPLVVHKGLLCKYSPYFTELLSADTIDTTICELERDSVRDFLMFMCWLYSERVQTPSPTVNAVIDKYLATQDRSMTLWSAPSSSDDSGFEEIGDTHHADEDHAMTSSATTIIVEPPFSPSSQDTGTHHYLAIPYKANTAINDLTRMKQTQQDLISLFIFAETHNVPHLRNDIMNRLIELRSKRWPLLTTSATTIHNSYASLAHDSDLLTYLEEEAAFCWTFHDHAQLLNQATDLPPAFLGNVIRMLFRERLDVEVERKPSWCSDVCSFHVHEGAEEKRACKRDLRKWQEELEGGDFAATDAPEVEW